MMTSLLALSALLACSSGKLQGDCPDGQSEDADGNCIDDDGGGDGGSTDGGSGDGGSGDGGSGDGGSGDGGSGDGGSGDGGSGDGGSGCDAMVLDSSPEDGDSNIALSSRIMFELSDADSTATIAVATTSGTVIPGDTWTEDGDTTVWFEADGPLVSNTEHTAVLSYCAGSEAVSFTTVDPGPPASGLEGNAYDIDLEGATWVEPAGVGTLLSGSLTELYLSVTSVSASSIDMIAAVGDGSGSQDTCEPTNAFPPADFTENPFFQLGPADISFDAAGYSVPITDLKLSGQFKSDGSAIEDGTLQGQLDIRDLADLIGDLLGTSDPASICGLLSAFGAECDSCSGDGQPYCLSVLITDIEGPQYVAGIDEIEMADCHPDCSASYSNPHCDTSGW